MSTISSYTTRFLASTSMRADLTEVGNLLISIPTLVIFPSLDNAPKEVKPELLKPEEPINEESTEENDSEVTDESFDDITKAVSNFVNKYEGMQSEIDAKDDKIRKLQLEIEKLDKINNESSTERENINNELSNLKEENTKYHAEVERLQSRNKELEAKLAKSTELLNKIYQSISRK